MTTKVAVCPTVKAPVFPQIAGRRAFLSGGFMFITPVYRFFKNGDTIGSTDEAIIGGAWRRVPMESVGWTVSCDSTAYRRVVRGEK